MRLNVKIGGSYSPGRMGVESRLFAPEATILLLDSDSLMQAALRDALQSAGYLVVEAGDLGTAVDRIHEVRPDLLITRPYINSMPGHTAAEYLRCRCPGLPVLIVTGFMNDDRVNAQNTVERFYLFPQPFSRDELLAKVGTVLNIIRRRRSEHRQHEAVASD
jgi:DNA-binding response OmpR family regulator